MGRKHTDTHKKYTRFCWQAPKFLREICRTDETKQECFCQSYWLSFSNFLERYQQIYSHLFCFSVGKFSLSLSSGTLRGNAGLTFSFSSILAVWLSDSITAFTALVQTITERVGVLTVNILSLPLCWEFQKWCNWVLCVIHSSHCSPLSLLGCSPELLQSCCCGTLQQLSTKKYFHIIISAEPVFLSF